MALDFETALSQYGYVGQMAKDNPELRPLLDKAIKNEWDSARFERELSDTAWFKGKSERQREIARLKSVDPAEWSAKLNAQKGVVSRLAASMGIRNVKNLDNMAEWSLYWEMDEAAMRSYIIDLSGNQLDKGSGGFTGEAGGIEAEVRKSYADYGVAIGDNLVNMITKEILTGKQTTGGVANAAKNAAKAWYPQFAQQFEQGQTMVQVAAPYISTMANTLEVADSSLTLSDPAVKKALQGKDGKPLSLWEFERQLKDDPRWGKTKQAKNQTFAVLQQVGQDWGFA